MVAIVIMVETLGKANCQAYWILHHCNTVARWLQVFREVKNTCLGQVQTLGKSNCCQAILIKVRLKFTT